MRSPLQNELMIRFKSLKAHPASDELSVRRRAAGNATSVVPLLSLDSSSILSSLITAYIWEVRVCVLVGKTGERSKSRGKCPCTFSFLRGNEVYAED
jgi:hypothetical protein